MYSVNELRPIFDSAKSFYKKAYVIEEENNTMYQVLILKSYDTIVARRKFDKAKNTLEFFNNGFYSRTTRRHQKEFFKQYGLSMSDDELKTLINKGFLTIQL